MNVSGSKLCPMCAEFSNAFCWDEFRTLNPSKYVDFYVKIRRKHLWDQPEMFVEMDKKITSRDHARILISRSTCGCDFPNVWV